VTKVSYTSPEGMILALGTGRMNLLSVQGLEAPPSSLTITLGPALEGAILAQGRAEPRLISADVLLDLRGLSATEILDARAAIAEAMFPTEEFGALTITRYGRTSMIRAKPHRDPAFGHKRWNELYHKVGFEFFCEGIAFQDVVSRATSMRYYSTLMEFSEDGIEFRNEGLEFARIDSSGSRASVIENDGDYAAPLYIRFTGPMVNPYLRNASTGETIRISQTLYKGEYLEIDTTPGRRSIHIVKDGTTGNGMHYLDLASRFWTLKPGVNLIEIGDESPGEGSEAFFEFYPRYLSA